MTPENAIVPPFLRRVVIRNFKSIAACDVWLKPRTILVGRNGAGKSNFLDALHFISDSLHTSLEQAINKRGGIDLVRRQVSGRHPLLSIHLEFGLPYHKHGVYSIEVLAGPGESFTLLEERLDVCDSSGRMRSNYRREGDELSAIRSLGTEPLMPPTRRDRLYLANAAALPDFGEVFDALSSMAFYQLNPDTMKAIRRSEAEEILQSDGANIASAVGRLEARSPEAFERLNDYLNSIVPDIQRVERVPLGPGEALTFQRQHTSQESSKFYAASMSDGTLRALGILIAANQRDSDGRPLRLVGVEEPETALHPAAAGALMEALREVESDTQVILTTHSADLLDQVDPAIDGVLIVTSQGGKSLISRADTASLDAVRQHLYTLGDLLRMDQLQGEPERQDGLLSPAKAEVS